MVGQLINHLVLELTNRAIPWAGIAAVLAGTGSFLTGFAALKAAQKRGAEKDVETEKTDTSDSSSD